MRMSSARHPAAAGRFYEATKEGLSASLRECFLHELGPGSPPEPAADGPRRISAVVSPHAGYIYSGPAAAHGFGALAADGIPDTVVILGPTHHSPARRAAVSLAEAWSTPLGEVPVNTKLGRRLVEASPLLEADESAHRGEHSLEVQVPFLQFTYGDRVPAICPICIRSQVVTGLREWIEDSRAIGETLARSVGEDDVLVIASTDFSHHVPQAAAERQDRLALDALLTLDPETFLRTVSEHQVSTCGPLPVAVALYFCLARGPHRAELLRYYTSGDIIGDRSAVVGYASAAIRRTGGDVQ
jgi:AmmeMemoRadiSam system protein B